MSVKTKWGLLLNKGINDPHYQLMETLINRFRKIFGRQPSFNVMRPDLNYTNDELATRYADSKKSMKKSGKKLE